MNKKLLNRIRIWYLDHGVQKEVYIYTDPKDREIIEKILSLKLIKN